MSKLSAALALAAHGFFVFPIEAGKKSPPAVKGWQELATRNADTITNYWTKHPHDNIGIFTGKYGDGADALLVIDVDTKGGINGFTSLLRLELEAGDLPDTYCQTTPTGGRHVVYRVGSPVRQSVRLLGPGLDTRSRGGYIVGLGSTVGSGQNEGVYTGNGRPVADAPAWLVARFAGGDDHGETHGDSGPPPDIDQARAEERVNHYLTVDAPTAVQGQGGDEITYKVAARCKDLGVPVATAILLADQLWNGRCQPPWAFDDLGKKFHNAYLYGRYVPGAAAPEADFPATTGAPVDAAQTTLPLTLDPYQKMNAEYAFVVAGGGAHILWETVDAYGHYKLEHLTIAAFQQKFAPLKLDIGNRTFPFTQLWLEWKDRRQYDGLVFMPAQPAPERFFNLWRGFTVVPAEEGADLHADTPAANAVRMFLEHARRNLCDDHEALCRWLLGYVAHLIQRPWDKPLVALVLKGDKGVGKNAFIERIGVLLGSHFLLTSKSRYLVGHFNGHLENCLLFALDEAFWSGDKQAEGALKDLITGTEHVIEHKGKEPYTVANKTRVAILGNEEWIVPASHDERRFAVFEVGNARKQDRAFFKAIKEGMDRGGHALLLRYLMDYDLRGLDFNHAPSTQGLMEQKQHSLDPLQQWWQDCLESSCIVCHAATWPKEIDCDQFRAAFRRYVKERQIRSRLPEDRAIGRLLKMCAPSLRKYRHAKQTDDSQPYYYAVPELSVAREEWETFMGHPVEWPKE